MLGQGSPETSYLITAEVTAADIYGAKGATTTTVTVNPVVDKAVSLSQD